MSELITKLMLTLFHHKFRHAPVFWHFFWLVVCC